MAVLTLLIAGCSKPEEVISSRIALANQNLDAGKTADAIQILEKLNRRYPDRAAIHEALGFAYSGGGNHAGAAAAFVRAAELDQNRGSLRQLAAEAYARAGSLHAAAVQHRLHLSQFPADFQSWQRLGEIEEQQGNVARAIEAYLEWYRLRPDSESAFRLGAAFRSLNNVPQAKLWYEATIRHASAHIDEALLRLLEIEIEAGDFAAAERTVEQLDRNFPGVLDQSPLSGVRARLTSWRENQSRLAEARGERDRLARELADMRRGAAAAEPPPSIPADTAPALPPPSAAIDPATSTTTPSDAPPSPETAPSVAAESPPPVVTPPPADLPPALVEALQLREKGETQAAIDRLWQAVSEDDSRVAYWTELADAFRELKRYAEAEACILEARRRAPQSVEVETAYLNIVRESGSKDALLARLQSARNKFPENPNFAWALARELAATQGIAAVRTIAAYEDFLLLADPNDPRRAEAAEYLAQARRR